jgi:hypothetical protein
MIYISKSVISSIKEDAGSEFLFILAARGGAEHRVTTGLKEYEQICERAMAHSFQVILTEIQVLT